HRCLLFLTLPITIQGFEYGKREVPLRFGTLAFCQKEVPGTYVLEIDLQKAHDQHNLGLKAGVTFGALLFKHYADAAVTIGEAFYQQMGLTLNKAITPFPVLQWVVKS